MEVGGLVAEFHAGFLRAPIRHPFSNIFYSPLRSQKTRNVEDFEIAVRQIAIKIGKILGGPIIAGQLSRLGCSGERKGRKIGRARARGAVREFRGVRGKNGPRTGSLSLFNIPSLARSSANSGVLFMYTLGVPERFLPSLWARAFLLPEDR